VTELRFEGLVNARDVGGLPTSDGRRVRTGKLYRSETAQLMTEADVAFAVGELGIRRVVDLRGVRLGGSGPLGEDGRGVVLDFYELGGGVDEHMDVSADGFLAGQLHRAAPVVARVLQEVVDTEGATLLHCHTGKDRTGFVIAVTLALLGVSDDDIVADYERSKPVFETMLANLDAAGLGLPPEAPAYAQEAPSTKGITAMLRQLRAEWPSPADYLSAHGVERELLDRARAVMIVDPSC
jgi:hypothetical protein